MEKSIESDKIDILIKKSTFHKKINIPQSWILLISFLSCFFLCLRCKFRLKSSKPLSLPSELRLSWSAKLAKWVKWKNLPRFRNPIASLSNR